MPINVVVRTERGERVASLDEMTAHLPGAERLGESHGTVPFPLVSAEDIDAYPMLASVDPYGLTCFNRRQVPRLLSELEAVQGLDPNDSRRALIAGLRVLAAEHMRRPHTFLWFIGD